VLCVSDTGEGMSPEVLAKAFEPFFTTKEIGKGSGLGLAQVYGFAKQSGGGVRIESKPGQGTRVEVFLPRADADVQVEEEADQRAAPGANGACTILLIDDDSDVREVAAAMLEDLGCTVIGAGSGGAALDLLASGEPISLILSDYAMPGMNGAEVERAAEHLRPGVPLVFMTGYADLTALRHVGSERIIRKPFNEAELARKIGLALPKSLAT
jgi:CheY-like chemotaxis protein